MTQQAVFFTPHEDDETATLGSAIRHHLEAGIEVFVYLMTTGQNSGVALTEGLSTTDFIAARRDEMFRATRALGVRTDHVIVDPLWVQDGQLTVTLAQDMIEGFVDAHLGTWVKSYTNLPAPGRHADHVACGQAALNLLNSGTIVMDGLRLYVEPWPTVLGAFRTAHPTVNLTPERSASPEPFVKQAFQEYKVVDAPGGKHGIGHKSVGTEMDALVGDPVSYYHIPIGV
jgi:LmbE family N-acetylglucosaminyl deacetylase